MLLQYDNGPSLDELVIAYCIVMLSRIGNERMIIMKDERDIINIVWSMCRAAEWEGTGTSHIGDTRIQPLSRNCQDYPLFANHKVKLKIFQDALLVVLKFLHPKQVRF